MKILFCQFSDTLLNVKSNSISEQYHNGIFQKYDKHGYWKSKDFWELPLWIAETSGSLKDTAIEKELYIINNLVDCIKYLNGLGTDTKICFSVLDVNKEYVKAIIKALSWHDFYLGGYIDFAYFNGLDNVKVFNSVKHLIEFLEIPYEYNLDYALFKGIKTIPRLTLSYGCLNRCKFCTVEKTIQKVSEENILKQVMAFKELRFKLIYLNDKTFSQCDNFTMLIPLYDIIKDYNPDFQGFIIQTTCLSIVSNTLNNLLMSGIVFAVELGIETYNDDILYNLDKPQTIKNIIDAMKILQAVKVKIIPNIIIGLPEETRQTYTNTLYFLETFENDIYFVNIYNLALYANSELSKQYDSIADKDLNENTFDKTIYTNEQQVDNEFFYKKVFNHSINILKLKKGVM